MSKFITSKVRFSFVNLWEPKSFDGGEAKYSFSLIIPKSDAKLIEDLKNAIETLAEDCKDLFGGTVPTDLKIPLRDSDLEGNSNPAYKDSYFINASSTVRPGIVDGALQPISDPNCVYSGCFGRAAITFYAYAINGHIGIGCGLNNIQKLADGEKLSGRTTPDDDFGLEIDDGSLK